MPPMLEFPCRDVLVFSEEIDKLFFEKMMGKSPTCTILAGSHRGTIMVSFVGVRWMLKFSLTSYRSTSALIDRAWYLKAFNAHDLGRLSLSFGCGEITTPRYSLVVDNSASPILGQIFHDLMKGGNYAPSAFRTGQVTQGSYYKGKALAWLYNRPSRLFFIILRLIRFHYRLDDI